MKVLVCGGRRYQDRETLQRVLRSLNISFIIEGGASGCDAMAREFAITNNIPHRTFLAAWGKWGRAAGPIRNQQMISEKPDLVVAFPGGNGTKDMINRAKDAGIAVKEISP